MYESPIEMISRQVRTQQEDHVYKAVLEVGVTVDKDELIKALQYDRDQYTKGFHDALVRFSLFKRDERAEVAAKVIDDLAKEGLLNIEPWAVEAFKKKYTEGSE